MTMMNTDTAISLTQDRLVEEGSTMKDLLQYYRDGISPVLVGESQWQRVLECAGELPIAMGALPFGFELPLHTRVPEADFGVSMASETKSADFFRNRAMSDETDEVARAVTRLFVEMDEEISPLRDIVGRKLMLEYDIGSEREGKFPFPGLFLRPGERPIVGVNDQQEDVALVVDALVSAVGWESDSKQREIIKQVYFAQPNNTRMDSFGVFRHRSRAIRLAVMGFDSQAQLCRYLEQIGWPGQLASVESVVSRVRERAKVPKFGVNIDVERSAVGPTLGLTLIVKQRYTKDSRYWLDGLTDWDPFLEALEHEEIVIPGKLAELAKWVSPPSVVFGKTGRFIFLRGIHHIKLVICENELQKVKAYVFMVLSGAVEA